jgi:hypothetical protein
MNYGILEDLGLDPRAYIRNPKVPYIYYNEDGDWESHLPKYEPQAEKYETNACTIYGALNQIEILHTFLYAKEPNYSERFTSLICGLTGAQGQDPQKAHEAIRKDGTVDQAECPVTRTREEFFDRGALTGSLLAKGQNWLVKHDYMHEWLWDRPESRPANWKDILRDALKTSPLAVSVSAWRLVDNMYVSEGDVNNHYCVLYRIDDDGCMWVMDSYDHFKKKLHPEHNIRRAKRIWINKKTPSAMKRHIGILQRIINRLLMTPTFLEICERSIGIDVTPRDAISDSVACSETVTTLLKQAGKIDRIISGTWTLYQYLENPDNGWKKVNSPWPGDIVLSPTGSGVAGSIGHVGVVMNDNLIASNNSFGPHAGKFTINYTIPKWNDYYGKKLRMAVFFYRKG